MLFNYIVIYIRGRNTVKKIKKVIIIVFLLLVIVSNKVVFAEEFQMSDKELTDAVELFMKNLPHE